MLAELLIESWFKFGFVYTVWWLTERFELAGPRRGFLYHNANKSGTNGSGALTPSPRAAEHKGKPRIPRHSAGLQTK